MLFVVLTLINISFKSIVAGFGVAVAERIFNSSFGFMFVLIRKSCLTSTVLATFRNESLS